MISALISALISWFFRRIQFLIPRELFLLQD